ncbi:EAL domain-containing protein [Geminocystis herdmanii]|uniref:EAL domain-containing protein n=1 Tax=Geminocystis herdmanii TaxID=669359 RepID=UPI00034C35D9|nr:EAL domain-containing protein [Geminocystis herdmanii]
MNWMLSSRKLNSYHKSLNYLDRCIYLCGDLDSASIDLDTINIPIALVKTDTHKLIYSNTSFQQIFSSYHHNLEDNPLENYIKPYTVEQIFALATENPYLLIPQNSTIENRQFNDLYSLSLNIVTWKGEKVIIAIFHPITHKSIVDLTAELSHLSSLLNNLPSVVYRCRLDERWTCEYISQNCWDLTGYESIDFIKNNKISFQDLIYPCDRAFVTQEVNTALASHTMYQLEYRIVHKSGGVKWVWEQGQGIYSPTGEILFLEGLIIDITEKRKIEQEKSLLLNITQAVTTSVDFETALLYTLQKVCQETDWDFGEAWLPDSEGEFFYYSTSWFAPEKNEQVCHDCDQSSDKISLADFTKESYNFFFQSSVGLPGNIWKEKQAIWVKDITQEDWFLRRELAKKCGLKTAFGVPVLAGEEVVAILIFFCRQCLSIDENLLQVVETIASQLGTVFKHKQIELELYQSQRQLATIVDSTSGMFFRIACDEHWAKDYISQGCEKLTGYAVSELLVKGKIDLAKFTHPLDLQQVLIVIKTNLEKRQNYTIEYRIFTKNNQEKWVWEKGKGIFNREGKLLGIEGWITDISDRKHMEEALNKAENRYRHFFENAIEGIFQSTADGYYLNANNALAKIYGYDTPLQLMQNLNDIDNCLYVQPDRRKEFKQILEQQEAITNFESQVYRRDGTIIWISENARAVRNSHGDLLYYEGTVEDVTKYRETQEKLHHQAFYDNLTQLPNRTLFLQHLSNSIHKLREFSDAGYQFSVLFLDCDRFKAVNDSLGHGVGDLLLVAIGERLQTCLGEKDIVARLGGDEFTILCDEITDIKDVVKLAETIYSAFKPPFMVNQHQLYCGVSMGIFFSSSVDIEEYNYLSPAQVLQYADTALYKAKSQKRGYYQVFQGQMQNEALEELELENEIRQGLIEEEFCLYYQPIMEIYSGKIKGFESLIRWNHPQKGLMTPNQFIDLAEQTGLIIPMGFSILKQACHQLTKWHNQLSTYNPHHQDLPILSVNLSCQEFNTENFLTIIDEIIEETGINPNYIKLEITESCCIFQEEFTVDILQQIIDRKMQLWIDDFGTGYSSLSYLHKLPIHGLKLDRYFTANLEENPNKVKIVKAILSLAQDLGLEVVAEGIETKEQLIILEEIGCKLGQGYLFSRPLCPENAFDFFHYPRCM